MYDCRKTVHLTDSVCPYCSVTFLLHRVSRTVVCVNALSAQIACCPDLLKLHLFYVTVEAMILCNNKNSYQHPLSESSH